MEFCIHFAKFLILLRNDRWVQYKDLNSIYILDNLITIFHLWVSPIQSVFQNHFYNC